MTTTTTIAVLTYSIDAVSAKYDVKCATLEVLQDNIAFLVSNNYDFSVTYRDVDARSLNQCEV